MPNFPCGRSWQMLRGPNSNNQLAMSDPRETEVVARSQGKLEDPNIPEGLDIKYDIRVTRDKSSPQSEKTLGEQIMEKIKESGL